MRVVAEMGAVATAQAAIAGQQYMLPVHSDHSTRSHVMHCALVYELRRRNHASTALVMAWAQCARMKFRKVRVSQTGSVDYPRMSVQARNLSELHARVHGHQIVGRPRD